MRQKVRRKTEGPRKGERPARARTQKDELDEPDEETGRWSSVGVVWRWVGGQAVDGGAQVTIFPFTTFSWRTELSTLIFFSPLQWCLEIPKDSRHKPSNTDTNTSKPTERYGKLPRDTDNDHRQIRTCTQEEEQSVVNTRPEGGLKLHPVSVSHTEVHGSTANRTVF